jgi:hypothetical protein
MISPVPRRDARASQWFHCAIINSISYIDLEHGLRQLTVHRRVSAVTLGNNAAIKTSARHISPLLRGEW